MEFWNNVKVISKKLLKLAPVFIAAASVITAATPTPVDDGIIAALHKALDIIAFNSVGHNRPEQQYMAPQDGFEPPAH